MFKIVIDAPAIASHLGEIGINAEQPQESELIALRGYSPLLKEDLRPIKE